MSGTVIVGGGQAAASLAAKLRAEGYRDPVTIIGAEPVAPYQRPPLSKAYLLGDMPLDRLTLRAPEFWRDNAIGLRLGEEARAIDPEAKILRVGRDEVAYDHLALCTGASPRRLPMALGGALPGVYCVRNLADVDLMAPLFVAGARLVVIGGGYIGLEAAAVARKLGLEVSVVEAAPRILGRVACAETAGAIRDLHTRHGVTLREGTGIERLTGNTHVTGVDLVDGTHLPADFVITGIGVSPDTQLAEEAGLLVQNGIVTNAYGQTSNPYIWAAGDCAEIEISGLRTRLESVGNAVDMGECVAHNILGAQRPYHPKPWFWSDQFDAKLQIAGWNAGYDQVITRHDDGDSFWYFRQGRLVAVDALNDPRAYMVGKRLIEADTPVSAHDLGDPSTELKQLMRR
ncbi:NAD(P)/FAD-dependent oxidoreductase [Rhodobacteraceae bacterium]|nr:NAD(P)/FAD-dependent oxidoreductase [Paracoccaceae bacterium]